LARNLLIAMVSAAHQDGAQSVGFQCMRCVSVCRHSNILLLVHPLGDALNNHATRSQACWSGARNAPPIGGSLK
jgi:hypothetical protein